MACTGSRKVKNYYNKGVLNMLGLQVHYKNKYPKGKIEASENSFDVYDQHGEHCVALRKDGAGNLVCQSEKLGLKHKHDLSPIPKMSRLYKVCPQKGVIKKDEKFEERVKAFGEFFCEDESKIMSCEELSAVDADGKPLYGYKFNDKQEILEAPKAQG